MIASGPTSRRAPSRPSHGPPPLWADIPSFTAFAQEVEQALEGPELRYSHRLHLLRRAQHFGIGRFDANLVIAMVQHRMYGATLPAAEPETRRKRPSFTLVVAGVTQIVIVAALWWLLQ